MHRRVIVLTMVAACGSGPIGPKNAPVEPPPAPAAQIPIDAPGPDAPPAPPKLSCDDGTAAMPAPGPDPTWFCARPDGIRHGKFITLFPDDTIEIAGSYKDGKLDGAWERHHPNGAVAERGSYAAGKRTGHWEQWSTAGKLLGGYDLVSGTGIEHRWYDDGNKYSERGLKGGIPHGAYKVFAPDGFQLVAAKYLNGKLDGPHSFGTRQSTRVEETLLAGVRRGSWKLWQGGILIADFNFDTKGRLDGPYVLWRSAKVMRLKGQMSEGKRIGDWVWNTSDDHKEREGSYVDGKKTGPWIEYWSEDKVMDSGNYTDGKPDGEFIYNDRNGTELGRFTITAGTGVMETYFPNKKPMTRQHLVDGALDGLYEELTNRGKVVVEGHYKAGVKHGTWKEWTPEHVPTLEQHWLRGRLHGAVKKFVDGQVATQSTYKDGKADGPYRELRNGKPAVTGQFTADRRHGVWTYYNAEGSVILTATYNKGVLDGPWRQLTDGEVIEGMMVAGRRSGEWTRTDRAGSVRKLTYTAP